MARPVGATTRPQFYTYITEVERKDFVKWIKQAYKNDKELAKWYGDQMFGKATQTIAGDADAPLTLKIVSYERTDDSIQLDSGETSAPRIGK